MNNFDPQTGVPLYEQKQINIPAQSEPITRSPKRKRKLPLIILLTLLVFLIYGSALYFFSNGSFKTKKDKVFNGMSNTFSSSSDSLLSTYLGSTQLSDKLQYEEYAVHYSLFLAESSINDLVPFIDSGFSSDTIINIPDSEISTSISIDYAGEDFLTSNFYAKDDNLSFSCADIFEGYLQCQTENFSDKFNSSNIASLLDEQISEDIDFNIFDLFSDNVDKTNDNTETMLSFISENGKDLLILKEAITVTSIDPKKLTIDGKDMKCKQYDVLIPKEELSTFLTTFFAFIDEEYTTVLPDNFIEETFTEDVHLHVALYKNKMTYLKLLEYNFDDESTIRAEFSFLGKSTPLDEIIGTINTVESESDSNNELNFTIETTNTNSTTARIAEFYIDDSTIIVETEFNNNSGNASIYFTIDDLMTFSLDGEFEDVTTGEAFTYIIDDLDLTFNDGIEDYSINLSGAYGINTADCKVNIPLGTSYDLFTMTDSDVEELLSNISETVEENDILYALLINSGINFTNKVVWDGYSNPYSLYDSNDFTKAGYIENLADDPDYYIALSEYYDDYYDLYNNINDYYGYDTFLEYIDIYIEGVQDVYYLDFDTFILEINNFYTVDITFEDFWDYLDFHYLNNTKSSLFFPDGIYAELPVPGYTHEDFIFENMMDNMMNNSSNDYYKNFYDYYMEYFRWNYTFLDFPSYDDFYAYIQYFARQNYEYRCTKDPSDVFDITDYLVELDAYFDIDGGTVDDFLENKYSGYPNW